MSGFEVPEPIICSPFEEPKEYWHIVEGEQPSRRPGRRPAVYYYHDPKGRLGEGRSGGMPVELPLVNAMRVRVKKWRDLGYPGTTRTTLELLRWWRREGRQQRLFFAQLDAAETIIFLREARADLRSGVENDIPRDEPSEEKKAQGFAGFWRYACKLATGAGKTTLMAMLTAWSILNKVNDRGDARFSDVVLVVCPNVTIRNRLRELRPEEGDASLYRTRDIVPPHLMPLLTQGRVVVTNWHVFEPQSIQVGGVSARVLKAGNRIRVRETIKIGQKTTTARGSRYLTKEDFDRQLAAGLLAVLDRDEDESGNLKSVSVESDRYVESDTAVVDRVLGTEVGGKKNILVLNDEAHHAYRIRRETETEEEEEPGADEDEEKVSEEFLKEATVWIDGLDRIQKLRGINFCVDLSATPYYLGRVGQDTNRPFPWVVSDFGLTDAIESGLVKIPQLAVRDTTGADIPGYFNIWHWILPKLTAAERGGRKANPKPEAILKWADHPVRMLAGLWEKECEDWKADPARAGRHPVFIIVAKNTKLAKVIYEWLADDKAPTGIPPAKVSGFRNKNGVINTIRVDSKVVSETDTGEAKEDESRWMRLTLDTVGKTEWPRDRQDRPIYPEGFEELAKKLERPLHPPGRDVRCIVSVGMLTEGWDCTTVTHIIGLRPFMSQLLCEQVVGRGLRRASYDLGPDERFSEEVAKVFGVPFEVIPFKANKQGKPPPPVKRNRVHAIPERAKLEIRFPRVEGYTQAIRNRITVDWVTVPPLELEPGRIPPEVEVKGLNVNNKGRLSLSGPGRVDEVTLREFRAKRRRQELVFDLARSVTLALSTRGEGVAPAHILFPQIVPVVERYLAEHVRVRSPADVKDLFLSPYYGWVVERLLEAIGPDTAHGETPEVPRYDARGPGSTAEVDFWTSRDVREVVRSHVNYVVADTRAWEQSAAYYLDRHPAVLAFVKNAGLGFAIPYLHNGQDHDYEPDFVIRLRSDRPRHLILETKGYDPLAEVKRAAAERWVRAVNHDGSFGRWDYRLVRRPEDIPDLVREVAKPDFFEADATPVVIPEPDLEPAQVAEPRRRGEAWSDWVSASRTRNYVLRDPLLDWLDLHGEAKGFTRDDKRDGFDERTDFTRFLFERSRAFEGGVVKHLRGLADVVQIAESAEDTRDPAKAEATLDAMRSGVAIVYQGVLHDPETRTYGAPDLLVRSDVLARLVPGVFEGEKAWLEAHLPDARSAAALPAPALGNKKWHYRVVDMKFTTLHLLRSGEVGNGGSGAAYKAQLYVYNRALGRVQGFQPPASFLLGRAWEQIDARGFSCMERLGVVMQDSMLSRERSLADEVEAAVTWVRRVRVEGATWNVLPEPSVEELLPNMKNGSDGPWHFAKKKIAEEVGELTLLWQVGVERRDTARRVHKIRRWDDPKLTPKEVGVNGEKTRRVLEALLAVNRGDGAPVQPERITALESEWRAPSPLEFFVDFETVSDLNDDFSKIPERGGTPLIFMVGCGHVDHGKWTFRCFTAKGLTEGAEAEMLDAWFAHMTEVATRLKVSGGPRVFHWSPAEVTTLETAYNAARRRHQDKTWPEPLWFDFLNRVVKAEPVVVRGAMGFGLKEIGRALHGLGKIKTLWREGPADGLGAMVGAWAAWAEAKKRRVSLRETSTMAEIEHYNELDCRVMQEVIAYFRKRH